MARQVESGVRGSPHFVQHVSCTVQQALHGMPFDPLQSDIPQLTVPNMLQHHPALHPRGCLNGPQEQTYMGHNPFTTTVRGWGAVETCPKQQLVTASLS